MHWLDQIEQKYNKLSLNTHMGILVSAVFMIIVLVMCTIIQTTSLSSVKDERDSFRDKYVEIVKSCNTTTVVQVDDHYYKCAESAVYDEKKIRAGIVDRVKGMKVGDTYIGQQTTGGMQ